MAGRPREGLSARLEADGTYMGEIHRECVFRRSEMRCRTRFCSGLRDLPPLMAWMTPWLSEWMTKCASEWPSDIMRSRPSSMAMNSAHPMLRLFDLHPAQSSIASQCLSKTIPMPQSVDASTQNSMGEGGGGWDRVEPHVSFPN